jgi:hypothetical protein
MRSAYVSTRQHTSAYVGEARMVKVAARPMSGSPKKRQHTPAYASIRQHTSAYVSIPGRSSGAVYFAEGQESPVAGACIEAPT